MFGLEKIEMMEKIIKQTRDRMHDLDAEINVLRNEVKEVSARVKKIESEMK